RRPSRSDGLRRGSSADRTERIHPLNGLLAGVAPDDRQQIAVHRPAAGHDVAAGEKVLAAVEVSDDAAGLAQQQDAGADIPRREAELEEAVIHPGRRVGEVERRRAAAADGLGGVEDLAEDLQIEVERREGAERIARGEERALE